MPYFTVLSAELPQRPNIVLILTDDMGFADLGCYGSKSIKTPNLDRMAAEGARLTQFYTNGPVCTPTRAALMTGRYQQRVGLEWATGPGNIEPGLLVGDTCVARMFKDNGYATAMFGKWHLGYKPEFGPNAHGFDEFFGLLSGNHDFYSHKESNGGDDLYEQTEPVKVEGYTTDLLTRRAVDYIRKTADKPFFLYVAYNGAHWPFQVPGTPNDIRTKENWQEGKHEDFVKMVECIDDGIGSIEAALKEKNVADRTLIVYSHDNGGERFSDNGGFAERKGSLFEGGIRSPCILRWPGHLPAGKVSDQPAITMDLTATVLAAASISPPSGRKLDGMDLLPILEGKTPNVSRTFCWRIHRPNGGKQQWAVRDGDWKYVINKNTELLFDLGKDRVDANNIVAQHPEVAQRLRKIIADWEADVDNPKPMYSVR